jgi:hypothetical protein
MGATCCGNLRKPGAALHTFILLTLDFEKKPSLRDINHGIKWLMATLGAYRLLPTQEDGNREESPSQRRKKLG